MNSCDFITSISTIACLISRTCSEDEIAILAAVFTQLGDTLATVLAHSEICGKEKEKGTAH